MSRGIPLAPQVIVMYGLPASGKTTWAKLHVKTHRNTKRISKDDLRAMLDNGEYSEENEKFVLKLRDFAIVQALQDGYNVVVDDCNLHPSHLETIKELVRPPVRLLMQRMTHVPLSLCIERDKKREKPVGEQAIRAMYEKYLKGHPLYG